MRNNKYESEIGFNSMYGYKDVSNITETEQNELTNAYSSFQAPRVKDDAKESNCCCKKSMVEALKLLYNKELCELIDFEKFAFLSDDFIVGARLVLLKSGSEEKDNLSNLEGSFEKFSPCNCDVISIKGKVFYNFPLPFSLTDLAEELCTLIRNILDIVAIQPIVGSAVGILEELLKIFNPLDFNEKL